MRSVPFAELKGSFFAVDDSSLNLLGEVCELAGRSNRYDEELARLADTSQSKAMRRKLAGLLLARGKDDAAAGILTRLLEGDGFDIDAACLVARLDVKRDAFHQSRRECGGRQNGKQSGFHGWVVC